MNDGRPDLGEAGVDFLKFFLTFGQVIIAENGTGRAFWLAERAVYALIRVNDQKIRPFAETVHWADIYTVCVFALNTRFSHHVCHGGRTPHVLVKGLRGYGRNHPAGWGPILA
ncbi:protein of unknown function [Acidithiobacillus ferrivorans]|uniref:Uncharacterized protein n=1 Tax=Acidithiobacillus ferrivorans TaxID=160808 RepID=A0A060UR14_9PROT|nr:hypothetical protein AFERRI_240087 [Acidithiobacillus ferrivorans]SMH64924.1 protein of unknown function [Acidithiobacillus ferrivorans]